MLLLPFAATGQTNKRIRELQQQSAALKKQISDSETLLKTTKKDVSSQLNNLAVINSQITAQENFIDTVQAEVTAMSIQIAKLQNEVKALQSDLAACKLKYRRTLLYMNRNRLTQNRWMFILMSSSFRQMYRRMRYAADYSKYLRAQGDVIKQKEQAVRDKQTALETAKRDKDALLADAKAQRAALESQKAERQRMVDELNKKQKQIASTINQQKRNYSKLNSRIDALIQEEIRKAEERRKKEEAARKAAEEKKRKEQAARAAAAKKKGSSSSGSSSKSSSKTSSKSSSSPRYEEADDTDRTVSTNFRANKGRLPIPITGSYAITSRYGQYNVEGLSDVTLDSKGINLTGKTGAQARCVFNGEVSAIANIGGNYVVIVRHGGYFSVYSGLSNVKVRNGQKVTTRQILGNVAKDAAGNCTLHFQLRQRSGSTATHINPLPWLAR